MGELRITPTWRLAIQSWLTVLRASHKPETTLALRSYQLRRLAADLPHLGPYDIDGDTLLDWFAAKPWGRSTRRSSRSALRSFYTWAQSRGHVAANPALFLPAVSPRPPDPHPTPEDAYRVALSRAGDRERLMIRIAAETGMRRGEVAKVHSDHLERDFEGWSLRVHGKGDRTRRLPVSDGLAATIRRQPTGFLFPGAVDGHLSPAWVGKLVSRAMPGAWTMHSLRHRYATMAYSHERDMFATQDLLGHADPRTTRLYVLIPSSSMRRAAMAVAAAS